MELQFYAFLGLFFLICVAIMVHVNHQLMKGADKRLKSANDMVLKLSESCDKLADTNVKLQQHIIELDTLYDSKIKDCVKARDEMREAYIKLLHKYEMLEEKAFTTLQEMAARPTITNTHKTTELK